MSDDIKEEIMTRMRKDPKLFNTQKKILSLGLKALDQTCTVSVAEFKCFGSTYGHDTEDVRLMRIAEWFMFNYGSQYKLDYRGLMSGKDITACDVLEKFSEGITPGPLNARVVPAMIVATGPFYKIYLKPDNAVLWAFLSSFGFKTQFSVEPELGLVCQHVTDFCRQFTYESRPKDTSP